MRNFIAERFRSSGGPGLSLDTEALAKYDDIIDLSLEEIFLGMTGKDMSL